MRKPSHTPYWSPVIKFVLLFNIVGGIIMFSIGSAPGIPVYNDPLPGTIDQSNQVRSINIDFKTPDKELLIRKAYLLEKVLRLFSF